MRNLEKSFAKSKNFAEAHINPNKKKFSLLTPENYFQSSPEGDDDSQNISVVYVSFS